MNRIRVSRNKKPSQGVEVNSENTPLNLGKLTQPAQPSHMVHTKFQQHFTTKSEQRDGLWVSVFQDWAVGGFQVGSCPALAELPFCLHQEGGKSRTSSAPWPGLHPEQMLQGQRMVFPAKVKSSHRGCLCAWRDCSMHRAPAHASTSLGTAVSSH